MVKIIVETKEQLDELYKDSSLTFEGLSTTDESLNSILDWVKNYTVLKKEDVYIISGKVMNDNYHLTGSNAYSNNCNIVCIKLSDMEDFNKIVVSRFSIRGRWFDDVVDNNAMRERRK